MLAKLLIGIPFARLMLTSQRMQSDYARRRLQLELAHPRTREGVRDAWRAYAGLIPA